jgi:hypothetical protein
MRTLFLGMMIGLVTGVISFFTSVAFLCFVLLFIGAINHSRPDMTLTFKVALPVAALATVLAFIITLVRSVRSATPGKRLM